MSNNNKHVHKPRIWYKLDNAAKIFPGQNSSKWSNIFRLSVELDKKIDPTLLEKALEQTLVRFPCFDIRMRRGFFWYYFEKNNRPAPPVLPDIQNPCHRIRWHENKNFLFRVYYYESRISLDFYHALSDAYGASRFLLTIVAQYLRLSGFDISVGDGVLDIDEKASPAELEDSFMRFGSSKAKPKKRDRYVYHARGKKMPAHTMNITTGYMPVDKINVMAKSYGTTITEFISAMLLDILYRKQLEEKRKQKDVSVQIPVNLRNSFPSITLRNFSLCYDVRINPNMGDYTFEEILKQVSLYLRYINNPKELNAMMSSNFKLETNPFMRAFPLFLKKFGIGISFLLTGERRTSILFSNLGVVRLPVEMEEHVERCVLMTGPGRINGARIGAVSYKNTLALTFANVFKESDIEREFFTRLIKMGISVKIESNRN
ncbi:MAG: hypothetical protein WCN92_11730 [Eubacteriales bacterium]